MKPRCSFLFVHGGRASWIDKISGYHADVVIFDREDSVPLAVKAEARAVVELKARGRSRRDELVAMMRRKDPMKRNSAARA